MTDWVRRSMGSLASLAAMTAPAADLALRREADRLVITAGEDPVAEFVFADPAVGRPAIRELATPGGVIITRPCPPRKGIDADDHATMHPGVWLCFSDLAGADPWRHKAAVRFTGFEGVPTVVDGAARFTAKIEYLATAADTPAARVVCHERSSVTIRDRRPAGSHPALAGGTLVGWRQTARLRRRRRDGLRPPCRHPALAGPWRPLPRQSRRHEREGRLRS
jgi:hypothetical protein